MLQLSLIVVLVVSMFVGRVSPVLQKEDHEKIKVEAPTNLNNTTNILTNSTSKVTEPSIKATQDKNEHVTETKISASSKSPPNVDATTPISVQKVAKNVMKNCNSTMEQEDMLNCQVTPHDDDDIIEQNVSLNPTAPTVTAAASNKTETNTKSQGSNVPPEKDVESGKKNGETVVNSTETTDHVSYEVVTAETDHPSNINKTDVPSTESKRDNNTSKASINTAPPLVIDKIAESTGSEKVVGAVISADQANNKRMPSGIIALVTAISFAVAIALIYVGMIVWRRYIEYRYGHRELLVNELEFDTNDLRHFEL